MNTYILKNEHSALLEQLSGFIFRRPIEDGSGNYIKFVNIKYENMIVPQIEKILTLVEK